ncbi:hypothetical protein VCV18_009610 [Metarhizium anisopliae]
MARAGRAPRPEIAQVTGQTPSDDRPSCLRASDGPLSVLMGVVTPARASLFHVPQPSRNLQ